MRIGIYGGAFDPIHRGHLAAAKAAYEALQLDRLLLIPSGISPHKTAPEWSACGEDRLEMCRLAVGELPGAEVLDLELRRQGKSYTSDTLRQLRRQYPEDELWLLMGTDMFLSLQHWHEPEVIAQLAGLAAFSRTREGKDEEFLRQKAFLEEHYHARIAILPNPEVVEVSSTQIRELLTEGKGRDYLTDPVWGYIQRRKLYGTDINLKNLTPDQLRPIALSFLKPKRMAHVLGTEQEAIRLARQYGADVEAAQIAALLHDCTKKLTMEQQLALCEQYEIPLDDLEKKALKLLHAKTGAAVARDLFGVSEEVHQAIFWHTTGKAAMTLLEKVIYLADYVEPNREFPGVERLREAVHADLDKGLLMALTDGIEDLKSMGNPVHHHTQEARDYLLRGKES